jgi:hypothetical protein
LIYWYYRVYFSQVIPDDVQIDARLFAVRSAKHVCIEIFHFDMNLCWILGIWSSLAISRTGYLVFMGTDWFSSSRWL